MLADVALLDSPGKAGNMSLTLKAMAVFDFIRSHPFQSYGEYDLYLVKDIDFQKRFGEWYGDHLCELRMKNLISLRHENFDFGNPRTELIHGIEIRMNQRTHSEKREPYKRRRGPRGRKGRRRNK
jgi:hypothetical protein